MITSRHERQQMGRDDSDYAEVGVLAGALYTRRRRVNGCWLAAGVDMDDEKRAGDNWPCASTKAVTSGVFSVLKGKGKGKGKRGFV